MTLNQLLQNTFAVLYDVQVYSAAPFGTNRQDQQRKTPVWQGEGQHMGKNTFKQCRCLGATSCISCPSGVKRKTRYHIDGRKILSLSGVFGRPL